jgi:HPt (histidine-containing phosphotransfer) domain-containing protein
MNDYVSKPLDRGKLMAVIAEWAPAPAEPDFEMDEDLADDPAPAVTPVDDEPVLDSKVMEDWQTFFSEDDFCELVTTQSSDVHECLEKLKDAAANRQMDEFERLAHSLKSSCGSLGMGRVSKIAKHIELACRDSRPRMPSINCRTWSWKSTRRWRFSWSSTPNT